MSGICAMWRKGDPRRDDVTLTRTAEGLSPFARQQQLRMEIEGGVGLAISARFGTEQIYCNRRLIVVCDADLCREGELRAQAGEVCDVPASARTAALIAGLYERFGCECVDRLRGAFSVILWDRRERRLLAAIDGFAIKRLVWYEDAKVLLVASRIDALTCSGEIATDVNPRAIAQVLNFTTTLAPETALTNVSRLLPGTMLVASENSTRTRPYWDMRYGQGSRTSEERLSRELETVVQASVADHCKGYAVPELGAFLSGGTDSSTVVGMMDRIGLQPVKAFSIGFREGRFNELEYAALTAKKFRAEHHTYCVGPADCLEALPRMVRAFDEPFANSSAIPTYFCARLAAESGTKVLLAGDGGDELFGGNERYLTDRIFGVYQNIPRFMRKGLIEPALSRLPESIRLVKISRSYVRRSNIPPLERFFSYHFLCAHDPAEVFEPEFMQALDGRPVLDVVSRYYREAAATDHLDRLLYVDVKATLGDSDLPKVTRMSELAGIAVRFPFLDRPVAEFSGRVPARLKVKGFEKRYLFKRAFRNLLPPEVIRKKKHGFGLPVSGWLKTDPKLRELARDTLSSSRAFCRGYFRRAFIEDLFRKFEEDDSTYYGDTVWTFLVLELWHREFVDQPLKVLA